MPKTTLLGTGRDRIQTQFSWARSLCSVLRHNIYKQSNHALYYPNWTSLKVKTGAKCMGPRVSGINCDSPRQTRIYGHFTCNLALSLAARRIIPFEQEREMECGYMSNLL